jgi:hypothetical protein
MLTVQGNPYVFVYYPDEKSPYDHPLALEVVEDDTNVPSDLDSEEDTTVPSDLDQDENIDSEAVTADSDQSQNLDPENSDEQENVTPTASTGLDSNSYKVKVTKERRVTIPPKALQKVFPTGNSFDISIGGDVHSRQPEKDGRVRITVPYNAGDEVTVTADGDTSIITVSQ